MTQKKSFKVVVLAFRDVIKKKREKLISIWSKDVSVSERST